MKNDIRIYIVYGIFTLILIGCGNKTESKTDNGIKTQTELKTDSNHSFIHTESDKIIELVLENNVGFLVVGKPTRARFETENINNQRLMIYGSGIAMTGGNDKEFRFTITPIEKTLVDGNLEIQTTERLENGENFTHKFLVPVKSMAE